MPTVTQADSGQVFVSGQPARFGRNDYQAMRRYIPHEKNTDMETALFYARAVTSTGIWAYIIRNVLAMFRFFDQKEKYIFMKKDFKVSILLKIAGLSSGFLFVAVFVLAVYSINQMEKVSLAASIGTVLEKIKNSTDKITRSTGEVLNKFEVIDTAVNRINSISTDNKENITILVNEVSRFKVEIHGG